MTAKGLNEFLEFIRGLIIIWLMLPIISVWIGTDLTSYTIGEETYKIMADIPKESLENEFFIFGYVIGVILLNLFLKIVVCYPIIFVYKGCEIMYNFVKSTDSKINNNEIKS